MLWISGTMKSFVKVPLHTYL